MSDRAQLEQAIIAVEAQRASLGDAAVNTVLEGLRKQLVELEDAESQRQPTTAPLSSERRIVTILFCDVIGSTAIAERLDPEEWTTIMNTAFELLNEAVDRFGGTVARLMGDAILAFFGAPTAHDDDPERAVSAGLAMLKNIQPLRGELLHERGLDFDVRVGINTGLAVVGDVGSEVYGEFTAMGDTVNLAARMEQTARPGTLQITENTFKLVKAQFECRPLGSIEVKGKSEQIPAYQVVARKDKPEEARGLTSHGLVSPLVSREAEFVAAKAALASLQDGDGGIVSIIGEAGIGKSRLLAEIRRVDQAENITWLEGHTLSYGQAISYWPFQEMLWGYGGITEEDSEVEAWGKLEGRVSALFPENAAEILPYLASLLSMEVRGEYGDQLELLDSEAMGRRLYVASRRFFRRLAQEQPLVLVFEDLHWVDESSANLLKHLLPLVTEAPLLIIGLSRPEQQTQTDSFKELVAQDYSSRYTEIRLTRLSEDDSRQLVSNLLAIENLSPNVRRMIVGKSGGNPFFLEEIIRSLIDSGAVVRNSSTGHWQATDRIETITLPDTLQGIIMARVDQLDTEVKQVLKTAAVIGRSFLYRVLGAVVERDRGLDNHLTELQAVELIREKQRVPELEYIFKHVLVQEAAYENILLQKRRSLHARVGQAIEALFADRLEGLYGLLAYHYARAESWEKAQEYLFKAADQEGRMAADAEALAHYRQALAAYEYAFGDQWEPVQKATLARKMGEALFRRGENAQAFDYLQQALSSLGRPLPASTWGLRLAILLEVVQQIGHRLLPVLFFKRKYEQVSGTVEDIARLYESMVLISFATNPERGMLIVLKMLNFSERSRFLPGIIFASSMLGLTFDTIPIFRLADYYGRKAVGLAAGSHHPGAPVTAYTVWAIHLNIQGRWDETLDFAQRALDIQRERAYWHTFGWVFSMVSLADGHIHLGKFTKALEYAQSIVEFGQESADLSAQTWGLSRQGFAQRGLGQLEDAADSLQRAMDFAESTSNFQVYVDSGGDLGQCYLRQGQLERAFSVFEDCRRLTIEHNLMKSPVVTRYRNGLAETYLLAAEESDKDKQRDYVKKAQRACQEALKQGKAYPPGVPEAMMLRGRYEWLNGKHSAAEKWWQDSLFLAEEMNVRFDLGRTLLEMGQRLRDIGSLERAASIFTETNSRWELAKVQDVLNSLTSK